MRHGLASSSGARQRLAGKHVKVAGEGKNSQRRSGTALGRGVARFPGGMVWCNLRGAGGRGGRSSRELSPDTSGRGPLQVPPRGSLARSGTCVALGDRYPRLVFRQRFFGNPTVFREFSRRSIPKGDCEDLVTIFGLFFFWWCVLYGRGRPSFLLVPLRSRALLFIGLVQI